MNLADIIGELVRTILGQPATSQQSVAQAALEAARAAERDGANLLADQLLQEAEPK